MSNLLYLLAAVGLSAIGSSVLYLRHRRPTSVHSGMKEFNRGLEALDPSRARQGQGQSRAQQPLAHRSRAGRAPRRGPGRPRG